MLARLATRPCAQSKESTTPAEITIYLILKYSATTCHPTNIPYPGRSVARDTAAADGLSYGLQRQFRSVFAATAAAPSRTMARS